MGYQIRNKNIYLNIKIILLFSVMLLLFVLFLSIAFFILKANIEDSIETELKSATASTLKLTKQAVDVSIRNYLRAIAEKNLEIIHRYDEMIRDGDISREKGIEELRKVLLSQTIGDTGYIFVWDISYGKDHIPLAVHPQMEGEDVSTFEFVQRAFQMKQGYMEYEWKNPSDEFPRNKAMYIAYYEPWQWVIAASSYRDEFLSLIEIHDIQEVISSQKFGKTGYASVIDYKGNIVIHPTLTGNQSQLKDNSGFPLMQYFITERNGSLEYSWKNQSEKEARRKIAYFNDYPELKWIVVSTGYYSEFYYPLSIFKYLMLFFLVTSLTIFVVFFIWSRNTIIKPIRELQTAFEKGSNGDLSVRVPVIKNNEIYILAGYFNSFMKSLQETSEEIQKESRKLKIAEAQSKAAREYLDNIVNSLDSSLITVASDGVISQWNQTACDFTGIPREQAIGKQYLECLPFLEEHKDEFNLSLETNEHYQIVFQCMYRDKERYLQVHFNPLQLNGISGVVLRIDDITEASIKDRQLLQAQKMEVIGNLAGGLAHDFNNILGGITGTITLIEYEMAKDKVDKNKLIRYSDIISQSATRAKEVVEQLLTISQKREINFKEIDLRKSVENVLQICRNTFDKSIEIITEYPGEETLCRAQANQIEQALLNLFINASHAMTIMRDPSEKHGGQLSISIKEIDADSIFTENHPEALLIKYWRLSIGDSGVGMDTNTVSKIFEPFFSLKKQIQGTGLGLSMVYNIIRQHGGFIDIYSEVGIGTVFNLFIPVAVEKSQQVTEASAKRESLLRGSGTILVVDDNDIIRATARDILRVLGYKVIIAEDGEIGVETYKQRQNEIDAIIMDMVMPNMSGKEAYFEIKKVNPDVRIAIASGYRMDRRVQEVMDAGANLFIQKPYTLKEMSLAAHQLTTNS